MEPPNQEGHPRITGLGTLWEQHRPPSAPRPSPKAYRAPAPPSSLQPYLPRVPTSPPAQFRFHSTDSPGSPTPPTSQEMLSVQQWTPNSSCAQEWNVRH